MSAPSTALGKGDHFSLFGLPRKLWIEMSTLEKKFLELSWKLHPDKFVNASPADQELSLKGSSELNDAYRVLRDPVARVEYLLELEGMRKEGEHKQQAPPELLEEVFELNESLDELRDAKESGGDLASLKTRADSLHCGPSISRTSQSDDAIMKATPGIVSIAIFSRIFRKAARYRSGVSCRRESAGTATAPKGAFTWSSGSRSIWYARE